MTYTTQTPPAAGLLDRLAATLATLGRQIGAGLTGGDRLRQFDATFALSDAELAARGLKRPQLAAQLLGGSTLP